MSGRISESAPRKTVTLKGRPGERWMIESKVWIYFLIGIT